MKRSQPWLACGSGGMILAGVIVCRALFQVPVEDSYPYHARVREAAATLPEVIGDWRSTPVEVPTAAQKLLRSNVLISRQYANQKTGAQASFLLVQCSDAETLLGHYPPVCYPAAGYTLTESVLDDRTIAGSSAENAPLVARGTDYRFIQQTLEGTREMWVYNLMVLPNGKTAPDMDGVGGIARNRRTRYFGAAEIQVITNAEMPKSDRNQVINMLLEGYQPLLDAIRSGVVK